MILLKYGLIWTRTVGEEAFWKLWRHEYDVIGHVRSSGRSPFGSPPSLSYRLPIVTYSLSPLVSEIFDLKVADTQTHTPTHPQNSTLSDNKGPLKLSAREPIEKQQKYRWKYWTQLNILNAIIIELLKCFIEVWSEDRGIRQQAKCSKKCIQKARPNDVCRWVNFLWLINNDC